MVNRRARLYLQARAISSTGAEKLRPLSQREKMIPEASTVMAEFFKPVLYFKCNWCGHSWRARSEKAPRQCRGRSRRDWNSPAIYVKPKFAKRINPREALILRLEQADMLR